MTSKPVCLPRKKLIRRVVLLVLALAALCLIFYLKRIFIPLGIALLIAYIVEPLLSWLDRHHTKRIYTVLAVYIILFGTLLTAGAILGPILTGQVKDFVQYVREKSEEHNLSWGMLLEAEKDRDAAPMTDGAPEQQEAAAGQNGLNAENSGLEPEQKPDETPADPEQSVEQLIKGHARTLTDRVPAAFMRAGRSVLSGARSLAGYLGQTVLVLFYAFFFMLHFRDIRQAWLQWIPAAHEQEIRALLRDIDKATAGFFRGRFLVCVLSAVVTSAGLFVSGIPYWLLLGLTAGFLGIIPVFGVTIALIPAVVMALMSEQVLFQTLGVLLTFGAVQGIVEPFVGSLVISKEVQLHPVTIITAFLIGNALFGILGVLLAVPLAGTLKILSKRFLMPQVGRLAESEKT
jgi:predicted PurR-regulated permease PerM